MVQLPRKEPHTCSDSTVFSFYFTSVIFTRHRKLKEPDNSQRSISAMNAQRVAECLWEREQRKGKERKERKKRKERKESARNTRNARKTQGKRKEREEREKHTEHTEHKFKTSKYRSEVCKSTDARASLEGLTPV